MVFLPEQVRAALQQLADPIGKRIDHSSSDERPAVKQRGKSVRVLINRQGPVKA